jgi:hypothetical protein
MAKRKAHLPSGMTKDGLGDELGLKALRSGIPGSGTDFHNL